MSEKMPYEKLLSVIDSKKPGDHDWFLSLLDEEKQRAHEDEHIAAVMQLLRIVRIRAHKNVIKEARAEIEYLERDGDNAENYRKIKALLAEIATEEEKIQTFTNYITCIWYFR